MEVDQLDANFQCDECEHIDLQANWNEQANGLACPYCSAIGRHSRWPTKEITELITLVEAYDTASPEYGLIASVFLSSGLELLLEHLLFKMAIEDLLYEEGGHLVELLLDAYQGRSRRLQLYARVGYGSFREETADLGHGEFLNLWNEVAEARNNAVHGDPKFARTITPDLIHCMIYEGLEVFAKLNNRYTRSWKDNIVADRKKDLERLRRWNEDSTQAWD